MVQVNRHDYLNSIAVMRAEYRRRIADHRHRVLCEDCQGRLVDLTDEQWACLLTPTGEIVVKHRGGCP